jgi:hypothetical protein
VTTIRFGPGHDDSSAHHEIVSDGGTSDITFGGQYDRSKISTRIFDLASSKDLPIIAQHLSDIASLRKRVSRFPAFLNQKPPLEHGCLP